VVLAIQRRSVGAAGVRLASSSAPCRLSSATGRHPRQTASELPIDAAASLAQTNADKLTCRTSCTLNHFFSYFQNLPFP